MDDVPNTHRCICDDYELDDIVKIREYFRRRKQRNEIVEALDSTLSRVEAAQHLKISQDTLRQKIEELNKIVTEFNENQLEANKLNDPFIPDDAIGAMEGLYYKIGLRDKAYWYDPDDREWRLSERNPIVLKAQLLGFKYRYSLTNALAPTPRTVKGVEICPIHQNRRLRVKLHPS